MILRLLLILASLATAQSFPQMSPWVPFQNFDFESHFEANGIVVTYGSQFKTFINLDAGRVHSGDSSVRADISGPHNTVNCNYFSPDCERHRAYTVQRFRGHKVEPNADSTRYTGVRLKSPVWTDFWYRVSNLPLYCHHAPIDTGSCDWESPATWLDDSTDNGADALTIVRDSAGYIHWEHVPTVDSSATTYQASLANDPTGAKQIHSGRWYHIQTYTDLDSLNGYGIVWVNGKVHSRANIHGRNGTLAQFHAGLYASSAVATGTVWNDGLFLMHVPDTNYAIKAFVRPTE